jgi:hypothetical protein
VKENAATIGFEMKRLVVLSLKTKHNTLMKRPSSGILKLLLCTVLFPAKIFACPVPGTYSIGPTGYYTSLTQAINDLSSCSLTGAYILEFQPAYSSSVETFPITIPQFTGSSSSNTVTVRPQSGASAINITSSNTTGTLLLSGAAYIIFDGRPGGSGSPLNLTIENTNVGASYALRFVNDASNNTFRYCNIKSANTSASSGTVVFSTAGAGQGNDDNSINACSIFNATAGTPVNAIYQSGSASPNDNSGNTISDNNIYNFYSAGGDMSGVLLANHASSWTISGNSFYQTVSRNLTGAGNTFSAIKSNSTTVSALNITGNYIGGTAASAGGTALTLTGSGCINAIQLSVSSSQYTQVHDNVIRNISFTSSSGSRSAMISLVSGKFKVGTVATPNIIGSQTATGSISVSLSNSTAFPSNPFFEGISAGSGSCDTVYITGNKIGGINVSGTSTTAYAIGIGFTGNSGVFTINNNIIGSATVANSISTSLNSYLIGIWGWASLSTSVQLINENTVVNLSSTSSASTNLYLAGILTQGNAVYHTTRNEVCKLTTASTSTQNTLLGIYNYASATAGQRIAYNKVYSLSNTAASSASGLVGIYYTGPTTGTNVVEGNFVHSLSVSTTSTSGYIHGIYSIGGLTVFKNNMVRLGIKDDGTSLNRGCFIFGMAEKGGATASNSYYHNSVYVGGTSPSTTSKTYAFYSTEATNTRAYYNNIFYNARSSSPSSGANKHYAIQIQSTTNLSADYNNLLATGTDKMLGYLGTSISTLAAWRTTTGMEANAISSDPKFIDPTGAASSVDLHINSAVYTLVEGGGTPIASVTDDYDLETRASKTPTDLGADAITNAAATKIDVGVTAIASPAVSSCYSNAVTVKATIKNYGSATINFATTPVTVSVAVTGAVTQNMTGTISSGTLAASATVDVNMSTTLNMSTVGTYTFNATISGVSGTGVDADITNDALATAATRTSSGTGITWLGVNTNWNDAANWCGGIPDAGTDITIPNLGIGANYPTIAASETGAARSISIANNAAVTISNTAALTISGAITNNGKIANYGDIILNGSISTSFPGSGELVAMNNLTINKTGGATVTFNKAFQLSGTFTPTAGNIQVNNIITLRSTADSTARVGVCGATIVYGDSGDFEVQRYIPAKRSWRLLTAPLKATASIYELWQNNGVYAAGKGMLITGPGAIPASNGLDESTQNNYSMKQWNISTQSFYGTANTLATDLSHSSNPTGAENTGYFVFVRGDRNPSNTTPPNVNNTTLSSLGQLQTGTQVFSAAPSSGDASIQRLTLIGNPYASPIDFGQLVKTNLLDKFYVWDPIPTDMGRYVTLTRSGGTYIATPDRGAGGPNQYIQSGQAFFVETDINTMVTPQLTVQESHKVSNNLLTIFRPLATRPQGMRINLYRLNTADNTPMLADGVQVLYNNNYSKAITTSDALKLPNLSESFSLLKNNRQVAVLTAPQPTATDSLLLHIEGLLHPQYRLEFSPEKINRENIAAFVQDKYTGTVTPLNMDKATSIDFDITTDVASADAERFLLLYRPSVAYFNIQAQATGQDITVQWKTTEENFISKYIIERSADGVNYISAGEKNAAGNFNASADYSFVDADLQAGEYFYRIKSISTTGVIAYSDAVKVLLQNGHPAVQVLPNPVNGNAVSIRLEGIEAGIYTLKLMNNLGQPVLQTKWQHTGSNAIRQLSLPSAVKPGIYQLEVSGVAFKTTVVRVVVL